MDPARSLHDALHAPRQAMGFEVLPGPFALLGFDAPPDPGALARALAEAPCQLVREGGETTLLVLQARAEELLARAPGARVERDLVWIRFTRSMDWEVVGFLALVSSALAAEGVPLGVVCGFSRDSIFVAARHAERARAVLARLFPAQRDAMDSSGALA